MGWAGNRIHTAARSGLWTGRLQTRAVLGKSAKFKLCLILLVSARRDSGSADQDPLAGLGDLPLVLELKLQLFNYLGQPLDCKGVCGLQGEPAGLLQLSFQYYAPHACHLGAPICPEFSKMCIDTLTIR
jgi:hypothetical protein